MTVTPTASAPPPSLYTTNTPATDAKKEMDQEVFLALLVAQLRNQDPTSPMDTNEMMAQSTQLASMEQLTALSDTSRESFALQMRIAASGMVGQNVSYVDDKDKVQTGVVSGVSFDDEVPTVTVGKVKVPLDHVSAITAPAAVTPPPTTTPTATTTDTTDSAGSAGTAA